MIRIPCNAIAKALYTRLQTLDTPVYDDVPSTAKYPFITLGAYSVKDTGVKMLDTMRVTVSIHIWTTYKGKGKANHIGDSVINALNSGKLDLSDDDFNVYDQVVDFYECYPEGDYGYNAIITLGLDVQDIRD